MGNLFVALPMGLVVFEVWLFQKGLNVYLTVFYSLFSFMAGLLREIIKDMEDMEGDAQFGCRTLPVVLGISKTKQFIYVLSIVYLAILAGFVVYALNNINTIYSIYLTIAVIGPSVYFLYYLKKADTKKHFHKLSTQLKLIMVLGIISLSLICI